MQKSCRIAYIFRHDMLVLWGGSLLRLSVDSQSEWQLTDLNATELELARICSQMGRGGSNNIAMWCSTTFAHSINAGATLKCHHHVRGLMMYLRLLQDLLTQQSKLLSLNLKTYKNTLFDLFDVYICRPTKYF